MPADAPAGASHLLLYCHRTGVDPACRLAYDMGMNEEETKPTPEENPVEMPEMEEQAEEQQQVDELTKWREMALRTAAEYDNYRKRCVKDREDFTKYANRSLLE